MQHCTNCNWGNLCNKHNSVKLKFFACGPDPPRKRIDSLRIGLNGHVRLSLGDLSEGSPLAGRRGLAVQILRKQSASSNLDTRSSSPASPLSSPVGYPRSQLRAGGYASPNPKEGISDLYRKHVIVSPTRGRAEAPQISRKHPNIHQGQVLSPLHNQSRLPFVRNAPKSPSDLTSPLVKRKISDGTHLHSPNPSNPISSREDSLSKPRSPQSSTMIPRPAVIVLEDSKKINLPGPSVHGIDLNISSDGDSKDRKRGSLNTTAESPTSVTPLLSPQHWRTRLNNFRMSILGSPRFHRKKTVVAETPPESPIDHSCRLGFKQSSRQGSTATPEVSPLLSNKSWFDGFLPLSLHNGTTKTTHRNNGSVVTSKAPATPSTGRHTFRNTDEKEPIATPPSLPLSPTRDSTRSTGQHQAHINRIALSRKVLANKSGIPQPLNVAPHSSTRSSYRASNVLDHGSTLSPEETNHVTMVKGRPFSRVKSEITHVLLSTPGVVHTVLSPSTFRAEYRRSGSGSSLLARPVKIQIDIVRASTGQAAANGNSDTTYEANSNSDKELYAVSFQLLSGPTRRFKRLCEQLQAPLLAGSGPYTCSTLIRPSTVQRAKQPSLESNTKPADSTPAASASDNSSQVSFIDAEIAVDGEASSISTLCSQFEASLAVNDSQINSMISDNETLKSAASGNS
uniref:Protein kinase domain-containing protein n=1 Tax=Mesocestoides corti TaxID=53468 RepID=A0A5K3F307_MESCO